jgi:hypothetical protein
MSRYRRTQHSSADVSDAGVFLLSNVKFRVSAPPARPLPNLTLIGHTNCRPIREVLGRILEAGVAHIFTSHGIHPTEPPELVFRAVPDFTNFSHEGEVGDVAVLTVAPWRETSPAVWENAVKEAKRFVDAKTSADPRLQHLNVTVEIIAEELTRATYTDIPDPTPAHQADWERIEGRVYQILQSHSATRSTVTWLALLHYGFSRVHTKNPVTVFISVDYGSEEARWPPIINEIQEYLDTFSHHLRVHIEHGKYWSPWPDWSVIE